MADFDPLDRRIRESFSRITECADPGRVTAAVRENLAGEKERSTENGMNMRRSKKLTVLLAAALTVILLTTAAAAAVIAVQAVQARMRAEITSTSEREGELIRSYRMNIEEHSGSLILSDEVMAVLDALAPPKKGTTNIAEAVRDGSALAFESWEDAANWLDCGLLFDPLLGSEPYASPKIGLYYNDGTRSQAGNRTISLRGSHTYPDTKRRVSVSAFIPLNDAAWEIYSGGFEGVLHGEAQKEEISADVITSPAGDEVTLLTTPAERILGGTWYEVSAHFIHEGIIYRISVWTNDRAEGESVVRRVVENMR